MDFELLQKALENGKNSNLSELSIEVINKKKNDILQKLALDGKKVSKYNKELKNYQYIDDINALKLGAKIRWIDILDIDNISLRVGGFLCSIDTVENYIICKVRLFNNKIISIKANQNLIFQQLNDEEIIILKAFKILSKK
tara:strand:+ start:149 stop:571 length:423 start_codon:yes stop_codon:yes gene_type:complete